MKIEHNPGRTFAVGCHASDHLLSYADAVEYGYSYGLYGWNYDLYNFPCNGSWEISSGNSPRGEEFPFWKALENAEGLLQTFRGPVATKKKIALEFWKKAGEYIRQLDDAREKAKAETPRRWKVETKKKRDELETAFLADIAEWKKEL